MMRAIHNWNNDAVELLLMGQSKDAVETLLQAIDEAWKIRGVSPTCALEPSWMQIDGASNKRQLYSVDLEHEYRPTESAFPVHWFGKPIAIATGSDCEDCEDANDLPEEEFCHDLYVALIFYNLGIAYQLEAAQQKQELDFARVRLTRSAAFESYALALRTLLTSQEVTTQNPFQDMSGCDNISFGLLHVAILNNLLFLYAQNADLQGMTTCLTVLRNVLPSVSGLLGSPSYAEDLATFQHNAILFPTPGSLSLSPAA